MCFEAFAVAAEPRVAKSQAELLAVATAARVEVVDDLPIGFINAFRPRPAADGIVNEMRNDELPLYQYWALRRDGSFYVLHTLFEEKHAPGLVLYDKRIARTAELLLYLHRLHAQLGTPPDRPIRVLVHYEEIAGKQLGNLTRGQVSRAPSHENVADGNIETVAGALRDRIIEHTRALTEPVFMLFDYFVVGEETYGRIVSNMVHLT
jgi:hypothetical protein